MRTWLILFCLAALICCLGCSPKKPDLITIGIIKPSIDHLPLSYGLSKGLIDKTAVQTVPFTSGWELQEALMAGKVDAGIIPFTYVWNMVGSGYPVKTVSFLERETDGVLTQKDIHSAQALNGKKIGMLKASTLDVLWQDFATSQNITAQPEYFRTPNEMIAALQSGELAAAILYVPLLNKLAADFNVLHWFSEQYPLHPCCDLAINTMQITGHKERLFKHFYKQLSSAIYLMDFSAEDFKLFMKENYNLEGDELQDALKHTKFMLGLSDSGKEFQKKMAAISVASGYLKLLPSYDDVYWDINAR